MHYNIYYKNQKINNYPLTKMDLDKILSQKEIHKNNNFETISIKDINIIKTIVV